MKRLYEKRLLDRDKVSHAHTGVLFLAASATMVALLVRAEQRGLAEIEPLARRRTRGANRAARSRHRWRW